MSGKHCVIIPLSCVSTDTTNQTQYYCLESSVRFLLSTGLLATATDQRDLEQVIKLILHSFNKHHGLHFKPHLEQPFMFSCFFFPSVYYHQLRFHCLSSIHPYKPL